MKTAFVIALSAILTGCTTRYYSISPTGIRLGILDDFSVEDEQTHSYYQEENTHGITIRWYPQR